MDFQSNAVRTTKTGTCFKILERNRNRFLTPKGQQSEMKETNKKQPFKNTFEKLVSFQTQRLVLESIP
jgi:hypothetical protein